MVCQMIAVGETTGALDHDAAEDRRLLRGRGRQRGRQPDGPDGAAVILFLGVVIGGLVISMYLPIFKLGSVIE